MPTINPVARIRAKAPKDLIILLPKETVYEDRRQLVNQRFNYYPYGIALCQTSDHVAFCIKECVQEKVQPRIRSGGHHHEGMSSRDNVLLIDLSGLNKIEYVDENKAWIPPGKKLKEVYQELETKGWIIPGGVCNSVNVGGLTQGMGWGVWVRKLGYTCDNVEAVEIVKADGEIIRASAHPVGSNSDLFWAVRGGGGGNFGVITKFLFRLSPLADTITKYVFTYDEKDTRAAMHKWANFQLDLDYDKNITVGGRLFVIDGGKAKLTLGGFYYGNLQQTQAAVRPLMEVPRPVNEAYTVMNQSETKGLACPLSAAIEHLGYLFNPTAPRSAADPAPTMLFRATEEQPQPWDPRTDTCEGRHPNKVSSAFPKDNDPATIAALVDATVDYIEQSQHYPDLSNYVSLHGIGGNAQNASAGGTPYPFRDKPFIYKIQAWWNDASDPDRNKRYIQWVRDFKKAIAPYTDGAFTNFQDKDLVENPDTPEGRIALLEQYYKGHLPDLQQVKKKYDPKNLFHYGMSIPLP